MLKLYNPIFPCKKKLPREELTEDVLEDKDFELVKFNEGYGAFTLEEWYWVSDREKESLEEKANKLFDGKFFESAGWYALTPIELELEVNRSCNLRCIHCWNNSGWDKEILDKDLIIELVDEFRENGGQRILVTGGEPLLYSHLEDIFSFSKKKGIKRIELVTNGTLIDKDIAKMLSQYLRYVNISIYGYSAESHEKITQTKGSFNKTINAILNLKEFNVPSVLYFTIMEENFDAIPYMFELAKELDIGAIRFNPLNPVGRAKNRKTLNLKGKIALSQYLQKLSEKTGIKLITSELNRKEYEIDNSYKFYGCNALRTLVYITNRGEVLPCSLVSESVGNVYKRRLTEIWQGDEANSFRNYYNCDINNCSLSNSCGGLCKASFKSIIHKC